MEDEILKLKALNLGGAVGRALVVTSPESGLGNRHTWMSLDGAGPDVLERMARKYNFSVEVFKDPDDRNPTLIGNHDSLLRVRVEDQGNAFIAHVPIKGDLRERLDSSDTLWLRHFPSRGDPCNSKTRGISDSLGRVNFKGQLDAAQKLILASCGPYDSNARLRLPTDCRQLLAMSTGSGKTYTIWSIACKYLYAFAHTFDIFIVCQASTRHEIIKQSWDFPREGALRKLGLEIDMLLHGWERAIEENGAAYTNLEYEEARLLLQKFKEYNGTHRLYNEDAEHKRGGLEAIMKRRHPQRSQRPDRPQEGGSADSLRCPKISNQKKPDTGDDEEALENGETLMLKEKKMYTELYFRFRRIRFVTYSQFLNGIYGTGPYKDFLECARENNNGKLQMVPDVDPVSDWEHVLREPNLNVRRVAGVEHPWPTKFTVTLLDEAHAIVAPTIDRSLPANQRKRIEKVREVLTDNPFAFAGMYFFTATPLVRSPADVSSFGCLLQSVRYFMKNNVPRETALKWSQPKLKYATEWFRPVQQETSARFEELQTSLKNQRCPSESKDSEDSKNDSSFLYELHDPRKLQALLLGHVFFYDAGGMARYFQPTIGEVYNVRNFGKGRVMGIDHKKGIVKFQANAAGTLDVPLSSFLECDDAVDILKPPSFESRLNIANPSYLDDTLLDDDDDTERGPATPPSPADTLLDDDDTERGPAAPPSPAPTDLDSESDDDSNTPATRRGQIGEPETAPPPDKEFTHEDDSYKEIVTDLEIQKPPSESRQQGTLEPAAPPPAKESTPAVPSPYKPAKTHEKSSSDSETEYGVGHLDDREIDMLVKAPVNGTTVMHEGDEELWQYMGAAQIEFHLQKNEDVKQSAPVWDEWQKAQCFVGIMVTGRGGTDANHYSHYVTVRIRPGLVILVDSLSNVSESTKKKAEEVAVAISEKKKWTQNITYKYIALGIQKDGSRCGLYAAALARIWLGVAGKETNFDENFKSEDLKYLKERVRREVNRMEPLLTLYRRNEKDKEKRDSDKKEKNAPEDETINKGDLDDEEVERLVNAREGGASLMKGRNKQMWGSTLVKKGEMQLWMYISPAEAEFILTKKGKNPFGNPDGFVANMKMSRTGGIQGHDYSHYVTLIIWPGHLRLIDTMPSVSNEAKKRATRLAKVVSDTQKWPPLVPKNFKAITLGINEDGSWSGLYAAAMSRLSLGLTTIKKKSGRHEEKNIVQLVREEATHLEKKLALIRAKDAN